jgi:hypothetical protein
VSLVNLTSGQTFINSMAVNVREGFQLPGDGRFFSYSLARVGVTSDTRITGMMAYFSTRVKASLVICNLGRAIRQSALAVVHFIALTSYRPTIPTATSCLMHHACFSRKLCFVHSP